MSRIFALLVALACFFLVSCQKSADIDLLSYQKLGLYADVLYTIDGESYQVKLTLAAPEYDEDGRMLARDAELIIGDGSIISGVSFELEDGGAFVSSGVLRIPLEDDRMISGLYDMLSVFCISDDSFYESEESEYNGYDCIHAVYCDSGAGNSDDRRVDLYIDKVNYLPLAVEAKLGERSIFAEIIEIRTDE